MHDRMKTASNRCANRLEYSIDCFVRGCANELDALEDWPTSPIVNGHQTRKDAIPDRGKHNLSAMPDTGDTCHNCVTNGSTTVENSADTAGDGIVD